MFQIKFLNNYVYGKTFGCHVPHPKHIRKQFEEHGPQRPPRTAYGQSPRKLCEILLTKIVLILSP